MHSPTESTDSLSLDLTELEDGAACFARAFAEQLKPPPAVTVSNWADQYRVVSQKGSSEPGPWRTSRTPYLREIMDELSESSSTRDIVFKKGTQVGGTEAGNNWLGYIIDHAPGPAMVIWPTSNTAKRNSKQRLTPLIDETPRLSRKVHPARSRDSGNTTTMKEFSGGVLVVAGANSAAELKSMPIKYLFADEIDEYPPDVDDQGDPLLLAEKRTTNFPRKKRFKVSSPTVDGFSRIDDEYQASDQRHYHVPCPSCRELQWFKWDQMRWELRKLKEFVCTQCGVISDGNEVQGDTHECPSCGETESITSQTLKQTETDELLRVWYECEHCQAQIGEHQKTWMLDEANGARWIADKTGADRAAGFHLSALYSPLGWYSWREAVRDYIKALHNEVLMKVFQNTVLAETYVDKTAEQPDSQSLKNEAEPYKLGVVPLQGLLLVASVDVQGNRLEAKVKAYGRNEESWLVEHHIVYGDTDEDTTWRALDDYLLKKFPHECGAEMPLAAVAIDSGYKTQRVYDFCRDRRRRHIFPVKGMPGEGRAILGTPTTQDVDYRGKKIKKGVKLWPVGTHAAKSLIYSRLKKHENPDTGELQERADRMHFPVGLPDEYYEQLTVERLVTFYDKQGHPRREFRKKPNERNETLDLEVYAYAAALYAGVKRKNWDKVEERLNITQRDMFAANQEQKAATDTADTDDNMNTETNADLVGNNKKTTAVKKQKKKTRRKNVVTDWS